MFVEGIAIPRSTESNKRVTENTEGEEEEGEGEGWNAWKTATRYRRGIVVSEDKSW